MSYPRNTAGREAAVGLRPRRGEEQPARLPRWTLAPLALAVLAAVSACAPADKTFVVDTTDDVHDSVPGDGVCATAEGACSLRAAIEETNATPEDVGVLVDIGAGHYKLTLDTGVPNDGLILSRGDVTLQGAGRHSTLIDGIGERRLLEISGARRSNIYIESLSMLNGYWPAGPGGAVRIQEPPLPDPGFHLVSFVDTVIAGSEAGWHGGGISAFGKGALNVVNSTVRDNASTAQCREIPTGGGVSGGGGIFVNGGGALYLTHSEVRDNCGSNGGGIRVYGNDEGEGSLILGSTIAGNQSATSGGGLYLTGGDMLIEDSTFTGNRITAAPYQGQNAGGIHALQADLRIESSTIVDNENSYAYGTGAGGLLSAASVVQMRNTVLADNTVPGNRDCHGLVQSNGGNFLGESDFECNFVAVPTDIVDGGDPELGFLGFNGGPTRTLRPNDDSPLIDAGVPGCEPIDQRAAGYLAPSGDGCDIGAVERQVEDSSPGGGDLAPRTVADLVDEDAPWAEAYPELRRAIERFDADAGIDRDTLSRDLPGEARRGESGPARNALRNEPGR